MKAGTIRQKGFVWVVVQSVGDPEVDGRIEACCSSRRSARKAIRNLHDESGRSMFDFDIVRWPLLEIRP